MKFITIIGPQAVGKMTVGQELEKLTGLKLFHNHMTIELVSKFFDYSSKQGKKLVHSFRMQIFEEVAKSDLEGLIFTYILAFNMKEDEEYYNKIKDIFLKEWAQIYLVELEADLEERVKRNETENRLLNKPTKRDIEWSKKNLLKDVERYRLNSLPGEIQEENYLRIDNTNLSAEEVAKIIKENFSL